MIALNYLHASLQINRSNMPSPRMFLSDLLLPMSPPVMRQYLFYHLWPMLMITWEILSNLHKAVSIACEFVAQNKFSLLD